jgi:hypothetical protein
MLDVLHIADTQSYDVKTYLGNGLTAGTTNLTDWVQWTKPRGIKFIYILGLGGGGSGGGNETSGSAAGGGGGGASGSQTSILLPEMFIPDVLYIQAGAGGKGLELSSAGLPGSDTFIAIEPYDTYTPNLTLLRARGGGGGGFGISTTGGTGGIAGAASTIDDMPLCRGAFTSLAGQNGGAGGNNNGGVAPNINFPVNGLMVTGGAGGGGNGVGGSGGAGGSIIKPATLGETYFRSIIGGNGAQGQNAGQDGGNGYSANFNIINVGGAGGGGGASGGARSAGIGGDAAPGAGGGGTGGGSSSNPVIKGGEGGPGYVMILCW